MGEHRGPLRTCVGCRQVTPATELVRFVVADGVLQQDAAHSSSGRGAWLHPHPRCVDLARRRGAFSRSLRRKLDDSVLDGFAASKEI